MKKKNQPFRLSVGSIFVKLDANKIRHSDAQQCILKILVCRPLHATSNLNSINIFCWSVEETVFRITFKCLDEISSTFNRNFLKTHPFLILYSYRQLTSVAKGMFSGTHAA